MSLVCNIDYIRLTFFTTTITVVLCVIRYPGNQRQLVRDVLVAPVFLRLAIVFISVLCPHLCCVCSYLNMSRTKSCNMHSYYLTVTFFRTKEITMVLD